MLFLRWLISFGLRNPDRARLAAAGARSVRGVLLSCEQLEDRCVPTATDLRIVTYNMEADISGVTTPRSGFYQVIEGIGEEQVQGHVQPVDILLLQETTSNSTTIAPIVTNLNSYYNGADVYAQSNYQATESGNDPTSGNGPNGLVYNTTTLNLLASVGVGTPGGSSNGEYRQVVRYEFQPVGDSGSTGIFYVYVSHMKSGTTSSDASDRGKEATIIRNDETTLPATASVLYTGDLNSAPPEAEFTNFTASGQGQAFDPLNFSTSVQYWSDSSTDLRYRDDYELVTSNVLNDTGAINYVSGSLHAFGNNGTTPSGGSVNSGSDTALNSDLVQDGGTFISASTLYADLTTASDHLPVFADYALSSLPATTTTLADNGPNPSVYGQSVGFTVTVSGGAPISNETVNIEDQANGNAVVGSGTLTNGTAAITISNLIVKTHPLIAVYSGDSSHAMSQSNPFINQTVNPNPTTTTINNFSPSAPIVGQTVTFNITVAATQGVNVPNGDFVNLEDAGNSSIIYGSGQTSGGNGTVTITSNSNLNAAGTYHVVAVYTSSSGEFGNSTSSPATTVTVDQVPAITSANSTTFTQGMAGTFTATASGFPTPTFSETGALPSGVTFTTGGVLSGTPTAAGSFPISITASNAAGSSSPQSFTLTVNPSQTAFGVASTALLAGGAGFLVTFNAAYDISALNLYTGDVGGTLGPRDVQVTGPGGATFGSAAPDTLRFNAVPVSSTQLELILTGLNRVAAAQVLAAGSYTLTLDGGSGDSAFRRLSDEAFLDGNGDGTVTAVDNYTTTVNVTANPSTTAVINIGDLVAGPGQTSSLPLVLTGNVSDTTAVNLTIPVATAAYTVTGFTVNSAIPGIAATFNAATGSLALSSTQVFASSDSPLLLGTFTVAVAGLGNPGTAPPIGTKTPIIITVTSVTDHAFNPKPYVAVDGFHVSVYPGDLSAPTGVYNNADVSQLQELTVQGVQGLALYPNVDPRLIADVTQDGNLTNTDVTDLLTRIVNSPLTTIPALPSGSSGVGSAGIDPKLFLDTSGIAVEPGLNGVLVPIEVTNTDTSAITISLANFAIQYDPAVLSFQSIQLGPVADGSLGSGLSAWTTQSVVANGDTILITGSAAAGPQLAAGATAVIYYLKFNVPGNAATGETTLNMLDDNGYTTLENNQQQQLTLTPAVSDAANGPEDAQLNVQLPQNQAPQVTVPASSANARVLFNPATGVGYHTATPNTEAIGGISVTDVNSLGQAETGIEQVTLALSGTGSSTSFGTLAVTAGASAQVTNNATASVTVSGTLTDLNATLASLVYTPGAGYYGTATITVTANDNGNSGAGGALTGTGSTSVTVVGLFISQIMLNRAGSTTLSPNQYVEVFSTAGSYTIPKGVYLVGIEGDNATRANAANNPGLVQDIFNLGGFTTGPNGYLAFLDKGGLKTYSTVLDSNGIELANFGTRSGFGNGGGTSVFNGISGVHIGQKTGSGFRPGAGSQRVTDIELGSESFLLIQAPAAPTTTVDIDSTNSGTPDGAAYASWNIMDGVGILDTVAGTTGPDRSYAPITFKPATKGNGTVLPGSQTISTGNWTATYVGRFADSIDSLPGSWLGGIPTGKAAHLILNPARSTAVSGQVLNDIGGPNLWSTGNRTAVLGATPAETTDLVFALLSEGSDGGPQLLTGRKRL